MANLDTPACAGGIFSLLVALNGNYDTNSARIAAAETEMSLPALPAEELGEAAFRVATPFGDGLCRKLAVFRTLPDLLRYEVSQAQQRADACLKTLEQQIAEVGCESTPNAWGSTRPADHIAWLCDAVIRNYLGGLLQLEVHLDGNIAYNGDKVAAMSPVLMAKYGRYGIPIETVIGSGLLIAGTLNSRVWGVISASNAVVAKVLYYGSLDYRKNG